MKNLTKRISAVLALAVAVTLLLPATAFAKTTFYVQTSAKYYSEESSYDEATGKETRELKLNSYEKYSYNKKGQTTKSTRENYNNDGSVDKSWTKYSYKNSKITKVTHSNGKYEKFSYKKGKLSTVKYYSKKDKLLQTVTYSYNKKGTLTKCVAKAGKALVYEETFYSNGIEKEYKGYDGNGYMDINLKYDKKGSATERAFYSYDADGNVTYSSIDKFVNTYNKKNVLEKAVSTTHVTNFDSTSSYRTVYAYYTSGAKSGYMKETWAYTYDKEKDDYVLNENGGTIFNCKLDKSKKNVAMHEAVSKATGEIIYRQEFTWKKISY